MGRSKPPAHRAFRLRQQLRETVEPESWRTKWVALIIPEIEVRRVHAELLRAGTSDQRLVRNSLVRVRKRIGEAMCREHHTSSPNPKYSLPIAARSESAGPEPTIALAVYVHLRPKLVGDLRQPVLAPGK